MGTPRKPRAATPRDSKPRPVKPPGTKPREPKLPEREIDLDSTSGRATRDGIRLGAGLLIKPRDAKALYVLAHGAGAGMRHPFMTEIAHALAARQIATLRWEFPYMAAGSARPDRPAVAEAAVRSAWLASAELAEHLPRFAGGKSFGGRMTSRSHAAEPLPDLRGIAFLGFPLHPPEKPGIERAEHLAGAHGPLLFVQGTRDDLADLALLRPVVKQLGPRATLHVVDGADHGFDVLVRSGRTHDQVIAELAQTIRAWIDAVLDT